MSNFLPTDGLHGPKGSFDRNYRSWQSRDLFFWLPLVDNKRAVERATWKHPGSGAGTNSVDNRERVFRHETGTFCANNNNQTDFDNSINYFDMGAIDAPLTVCSLCILETTETFADVIDSHPDYDTPSPAAFGLGISTDGTAVKFYDSSFVEDDNGPTLKLDELILIGCTIRSATDWTLFQVSNTSGLETSDKTTSIDTSYSRLLISVGEQMSSGRGWFGPIFDCRIYTRALTDAEVWNLFSPSGRWDLYKTSEFRMGKVPGRIMSSLAHHGGLAGSGGIAGHGGGLAA